MKERNPPFYRSERTKMTGLNRVKIRKCFLEPAMYGELFTTALWNVLDLICSCLRWRQMLDALWPFNEAYLTNHRRCLSRTVSQITLKLSWDQYQCHQWTNENVSVNDIRKDLNDESGTINWKIRPTISLSLHHGLQQLAKRASVMKLKNKSTTSARYWKL